MDPYEATKIVFSRIQNLDPENASKITGLLLIQDHGEKEMIRLAFGPENSLQSLVVKARQELGISSQLSPINTQPTAPFLSNNTNSAATTSTAPAITMSATTAINSINNNGNNPFSVSRKNSTSTTNTARFLPNGVKIPSTLTIPSLNSPNLLVSSPSWGASVFSDFRIPDDQSLFSPNDSSPAFLSAEAAATASYNGISTSNLGLNSNSATTTTNNNTNTVAYTAASSSMNSSTAPFYPSGGTAPAPDLIDEIKLKKQLSFFNDNNNSHSSLGPRNHPDLYYPQPDLSSGPGDNSDPLVYSYNGGVDDGWGGGSSVNGLSHRRSCSVSDINFGSEGSGLDDLTCGFGWKPCLYYARGYCKNGSSCRFVHVGLGETDSTAAVPSLVGSPTKFEMMEQCHEILRSKSMQHQKLMAAMASGNHNFPYSPGNKCLNFLLQQQPTESQRVAAAALMMGEDMHKFGRSRLDTSEFMMNGRPDSNPSSRQIYLTFPADSTFREEDVSNYFSIYGLVQDVRIPYQQKRMFGFVTFVYPETVKMILAKGNPHFVCDARVLVKPYKEKGKVPDKYRKQHQQQLVERGEFSACNSPTALDFRDPFDVQNLGARMMYNNTQEMLWRRKLEEQVDLQQAFELQNRRLMGLHLLDVKRNHHHSTLTTGGGAIPSPTQSPNSFFHHSLLGSDRSSPEAPEENDSNNGVTAAGGAVNDQKLHQQSADNETDKDQKQGSITVKKKDNNGNGSGKEDSPREYNNCLPESLEHNLPDSPFASPTRGAGACMTAFFCSSVASESEDAAAKGNSMALSSLPATSAVDMASFKSCYVQMPRFSTGHGAIGM